MAKKRKNKKVWGGIGIALLTIAATLGAVKLFGVPSQLLPEDHKVLECIGTINFDDLENSTRYKRITGEKYGTKYTAESYEYTFKSLLKDDIEVRILNVSNTQTSPDINLSEDKVFCEEGAYYNSAVYILDYEISYVETVAYVEGSRDTISFNTPVTYMGGNDFAEIFGDVEFKQAQKVGVASFKDNNMTEKIEEIVSLSFYTIKDDAEEKEETQTKITNKVSIDTSYSGSKSTVLSDDLLLELLNGDNEYFESATITAEAEGDLVSKDKGGLMLSGSANVEIDINEEENEFNRVKITMKHADEIEDEDTDASYAMLDVNGNKLVSYSNYLDVEKDYAMTTFVIDYSDPISTLNITNEHGYSVITSITLWNETIVESK